ncbi:MAG: nucleoside triphosphate pyrophosphohydrolase [Bryobacteraceae bacterium]|nr:nucleoside triphosphate pyrophosphohydrolase [Bryobacteraceae bacterium]
MSAAPTPPAPPGDQFNELVALMARLRAPDGCPWDQKQTFDTIKPYLLEETYEVLDAIDARDWPELREELGDLLLQPVFFAQMAAEAGHFRIEDCLAAINQKLIRRHPHIFAETVAETAEDVKRNWDQIKAEEKSAKGLAPGTLLSGISRAQPALTEAAQISSKAAGQGFDWPAIEPVFDKLREELAELAEARRGGVASEIEDEFGDILFVMVNLARFLKVDPEQALRKSNAKFRGRFGYVEARLAEMGRPFAESNIEEMELLWQEAKIALKSAR